MSLSLLILSYKGKQRGKEKHQNKHLIRYYGLVLQLPQKAS